MVREIAAGTVIVLSLIGIALGRFPFLRMNRAAYAFSGAVALILIGTLSMKDAFAAVDLRTLSLIFSMMIVAANLRISGFFVWASEHALAFARTPKGLLVAIVAISGVLSALFLNDTMCLVLTPLVTELTVSSKRDPIPYLIGVATASNIGSCATIIGNPQNMLIGAASGITFTTFFLNLAVPSVVGLVLCWGFIVLAFPQEFRGREQFLSVARNSAATENATLQRKSIAAVVLMIVALAVGLPTTLAAMAAAAFLLVSRRTKSERVFAEVDFPLLVFFSGLFMITRAIEGSELFGRAFHAVLPNAARSAYFFSSVSVVLSNIVSNVPAVMLLRPMIPSFESPEKAWLLLALSSTFAGNLTLLGSVANLIVAEGAGRRGIHLTFGKYLKVGIPLTLTTTALGTAWLIWIR